MENEDQPQIRKPRKSVAFTEEKLIVNTDGSVEVMATPNEEKDTALSHSPSTEPLLQTLASTNPAAASVPADTEVPAPETNDDGLDLSLTKKKKKKAKKEEDGEAAGDDAAAADDGGLDLGIKKKKKSKKPKEGDDDFAAKLAALDLEKEGGEATEEKPVQEGDMKLGTGIWSHDDQTPIQYDLLLSRFFSLLTEKNPDHATGSAKSYKIPPPQCMREGNKKTIFANIPEICKRMKRSQDHVTAFLFAELGTSGSVDGSLRLVIKGRFQAKQLENVLRKYIIEYVSCKTCRSPDTELSKGENRLSFVTCNSCGSRRSVAPIKTGFSAQIGKRRKMKG